MPPSKAYDRQDIQCFRQALRVSKEAESTGPNSESVAKMMVIRAQLNLGF